MEHCYRQGLASSCWRLDNADTMDFVALEMRTIDQIDATEMHDCSSCNRASKEKQQSSQIKLAALKRKKHDDRIVIINVNHPRMEAECKMHSAGRKCWWPECHHSNPHLQVKTSEQPEQAGSSAIWEGRFSSPDNEREPTKTGLLSVECAQQTQTQILT